MTIEARVESVLLFENAGLLRLELRAQDKSLQAIISIDAVVKETWDLAQSLTAESIIKITGSVSEQTADDSRGNDHSASTAIRVSSLHVIALAVPNLPVPSCRWRSR